MSIDQWNEDTVTVDGVTMTLQTYLDQKEQSKVHEKSLRDCVEFNREADKYRYVKRYIAQRHKPKFHVDDNEVLSTRIYRRNEIKQEEEERMKRIRRQIINVIVGSGGDWVHASEYKRRLRDFNRSSVSSVLTRVYSFFNEMNMMERMRSGRSYMYRFDRSALPDNDEEVQRLVDKWYSEFIRWESSTAKERRRAIRAEENAKDTTQSNVNEKLPEHTSTPTLIIPSNVKVDVTVKVLFGWLR